MALAASRTLLALFLTFCAPGCGLTADRLVRPRNVKGTTVDEGVRDSWEPSIHLDGTPVDRFDISSSKPTRSHRFTKAGKGSRSPLLEDVDPEWVNLDGFAVLGGAPVSNSSAGTARFRSPHTVSRNQPSSVRAPRGDRTTQPLGVSSTRVHRRAPQSSSGPRQPERLMALLERRRQFHTKPQSDQRKRNAQKLTSESVHVVSLQAQKTPGQSTPAKMAVATKTTTPEPPEYVAQDISVRVMSPQSVLVSWVDPVVEMGKATAGETRSYTVRFREKGESARWEYKESTQRRILIDTLMADSMYEFAVKISEGGNEGKWSISVFQRTPESAPSGPPENFEVKPVRGKGTAVKATWDPPEESNGRIREYILSYAPAMKPFGMKSVTYRGSTTTATIDGLTPGDRYIFKIRATNRRGQGPQSKAFSVAIPGSSRSTPSITKTEDNSKPTKTVSKQETHQDESDLQSTEEPEEPTTTPEHRPAAPASRRVRPLSQTRSYHSIFNSLRGSVRNPASRGFSRGRGEDGEDEDEEEEEEEEEKEEEEETPATTPATEETTTEEFLPATKEPENIISYDAEDNVGYDKEPPTTEIPSLKVLTPSPTKASTRPQRRPIKIRIHQKPGTKASSSSTSSSAPSSPSSSDSQSSSSTTSLSTSSHNQESAAGRQDHVASNYPESKDTYDKPSITHTKPATPVVKHPNSQQTEATSEGKGSASNGRANGAGFGSRYGNGRRYPFLRGNSSRILNGYKPMVTSQSNVPRTSSQAASKTHGSATSQSTLPDRTRDHKPSQSSDSTTPKTTLPSETHSQGKPDVYNFENSQTASEPKTRGSTPLHTSQSNSNHPSTIDTSASSSPSVSHGRSHSSAASHNTQSSHISPEQDTAITGTNDDYKNTDADEYKVERPTSSSNPKPTEHERSNKEEREETGKERPVSPRTRISQSFAERFPWLASRYPGRFGSGTRVSARPGGRTTASRTSSSIGADTPILRGTAPRFSGATGASGVSRIQETTEDITNPSSSDDSLKNGARLGSGKPSLTNQNTASGGPRNPGSSSSISTSSSAAIPSISNPYDSSRRQEKSPEPIPRETSNENKNDHTRDYLNERSTETSGKNDKVTEPASPHKDPTVNSAHPHKNAEENLNVDTSSRTRSGSTQTSQTYPRSGVGFNGRAHPSVLGNRQFGGSRLPFRTQPGENSRLGSSGSQSSASSTDSSSSSASQPVLSSGQRTGSGSTLTKTGGLTGSDSQSTLPSSASSSSSRNGFRGQGGRTRFPGLRGKSTNGGQFKPGNGNGKNGRPNLAAANEKESPTSQGISKAVGQKFITGPDGTKWVVDLELGVLMNQDGKVLQDSQGKPKRVVLGEDGRTIFDLMGSPLLNQEGMALFGHGRDSSPVVNPKDRVLMVGGKPIVGLDLPHLRTTTTTTTTATTTTTPEPTTTEWTTEEPTTPLPNPTCPPGTFFKTDEDGYPMLDPEGILDCYPEEQTTQPPVTTTTTTTTTTTAAVTTPELDTRPSNRGPSSAFDLSGKKRFTAPYVNYIQKDPGSPCSLTEALEYLQVDVLEDLMEKDSLKANPNQPPKNKPHNFTVVAMEGCHSFIILDWARPVKDDMVSGYMVYSASYDDVLNNRWSKSTSTGTHLAVENLKPNSRYYFKVQAKNVFGLGPISETLTYVTESDDPLLIERPPGGEPIWIPFSFKYNSAHSSCKGSQYVKRTWYRKFVGVVLCNSLRYKIFMGNGLREPFYSIGDTFGEGEDHCQFVDSYRDGRTGPAYLSNNLPTAQGYYRAFRQEPVTFGVIGRRTAHPFVGWYECGVPIPGKW